MYTNEIVVQQLWAEAGAGSLIGVTQRTKFKRSHGSDDGGATGPASTIGGIVTATSVTSLPVEPSSISVGGTGEPGVRTSDHKTSTATIAGGVIGGIALLVLCALVFWKLRRARLRDQQRPVEFKEGIDPDTPRDAESEMVMCEPFLAATTPPSPALLHEKISASSYNTLIHNAILTPGPPSPTIPAPAYLGDRKSVLDDHGSIQLRLANPSSGEPDPGLSQAVGDGYGTIANVLRLEIETLRRENERLQEQMQTASVASVDGHSHPGGRTEPPPAYLGDIER